MKEIIQLKISLTRSEPLIWRRIQMFVNCTFWDLHIAIQDVMPWEDCHLHMFNVKDPTVKSRSKLKYRKYIGIPEDDSGDILADWETNVADYLKTNKEFFYEYDFGDSWRHTIEFEGFFDLNSNIKKYLICLDGESSFPPEDSGGIGCHNYRMEIIRNPLHEEYKANMSFYKQGYNHFEAKKIKFSNPKSRLKSLFNEEYYY